MMNILGSFLRDAIAGGSGGACCEPTFSGEGDFVCNPTSEVDCVDNPNAIFYPRQSCSEVECGKEACCTFNQDTGLTECTNVPPPFLVDECRDGERQGEGTSCAQLPCDVEVPEDEFPIGCITKPVGRPTPQTGYEWDTNLCQNAQFRVTIAAPDAPPAPFAPVNYGELQSVGPIRANEQAAGVEPCARHRARLVRGNDGYCRMMMCGRHVLGDPESLQVSEGWFYLEKDSIRPKAEGLTLIPTGYAAVAVGYRAPYWVEAHYHSYHLPCERIP